MKVLHVTTHFNVGGISNYILTIAKALKTKGLDVLVASSGGDLKAELDRYGIPHRELDIRTKFEFGPKALRAGFKISRIVKDEGVDIIHAHTRVSQVAALIASKMSTTPLVTTCHGYFKKRLRGVVDTWGVKVIAISDAVRSHLIEDLGVPPSRVELVYSGVDVSRFAERYTPEAIKAIREGLGLNNAPTVGTIGRLSSIKGHKFFVESMKGILAAEPGVQALLLGDGEEKAPLKRLAESLGIADAVHFYDSCADTRAFLAAMDVFVFPSIKEGLGIALLEALAAGKACVASEVGGISDIITNGYSGSLVQVGDSKAIGDAVLKLLADDKLRADMGRRASALVREKFTLGRMADEVAKLYAGIGTKRP